MIIWGSRNNSVVVGGAGVRQCPVCNGQHRFDIILDYRYWHIWYLLKWVSEREYSLACSNCHNILPGEAPSKQEIAEKLSGQKNPIPFMHRLSWMIGVALLVIVIGAGAYFSNEDKKELAQSLVAPKIGDIYLAELSKISDGFGESLAYGAMKLVSIENNGEYIVFVTAKSGYSKKNGVRKDKSKGLLNQDSYYDTDDAVAFTPQELIELSNQGVIYQVVR